MIIAERGNQKITRNVSQFKKYNKSDNSYRNSDNHELANNDSEFTQIEHSENEHLNVDISEPVTSKDVTEHEVQHDEPNPKVASVPNDKTEQRPKRSSRLPAKYEDFIAHK